MYFNYLLKRDSSSLIIYSQDKEILNGTSKDIISLIFNIDKDKGDNNPDVLEISLNDTDKLSIGIEEIKNVLPRFLLKPLQSKFKVLVISDAEKLTRDAQGSLLKILEEPQKGSYIIIKTTNINSLLGTIRSRCDVINLNTKRVKSEYKNNILANDLNERLNIVKEILGNKDPKLRREEVDKMFSQIFSELNQNTLNISNDKKYIILDSVFKYQEYFKSEVNLRLTLENLMISVYKILKY